MKTRNMIKKAAAITGLGFAVMVTTMVLGTQSLAQRGSDVNIRLIPVMTGVDNLWSGTTGYQETELRPTVSPGFYDLSFRVYRNGVLDPVSSLPVLSHVPLVLFAHVEDVNGNSAQGGTVDFEYCGDYEPKETCDAGLARWTRLGRINVGSCYCKSCGGLPGYDPGPGNACIFVFGAGNIPGDDGFRFKYAGQRGGVDSGMSGTANFTWTAAP